MTIRNRRRNRWRRKLRRCNQCKHWKALSHNSSCCSIGSFFFSISMLKTFRDRYNLNGMQDAWWKCAIICPHYHAYDREANQLAQSTQRVQQRMSITEVKHYD